MISPYQLLVRTIIACLQESHSIIFNYNEYTDQLTFEEPGHFVCKCVFS